MPAMPLAHVKDHADIALRRLAQQFKEKPKLEALARIFLGELQLIEDAFQQLLSLRSIDTAVGKQLDVLGGIVGVAREGRSDESYRAFIRVQIRLNGSSGTADQVRGIFALLVQPSSRIEILEEFPAAFTLRVRDALPVVPADAGRILQRAKPVGVRALFEWTQVPRAQAFGFQGGPGLGFNTGRLAGVRDR